MRDDLEKEVEQNNARLWRHCVLTVEFDWVTPGNLLTLSFWSRGLFVRGAQQVTNLNSESGVEEKKFFSSLVMPASVMVANKAFCAGLPEKLRAKYEKQDVEEEDRVRWLRLVVLSRIALTTPTSRRRRRP